MDELINLLKCRLCGIKLVRKEANYIFDETSDLAQKISDTLSLQISPDDNHSKYICLGCYERVIKHYEFMQNVLELGNISKEKDMEKIEHSAEIDRSEEMTMEISRLPDSDIIYTCPNCNIDLMIIIRNNPEGCNYAFHISLAIVDQIRKEKDVKISEDAVNLDNIYINKSTVIDELHGSCVVNPNQQNTKETDENLPVLQEDINCADTYITVPKENVSHQTSRGTKRKFQENVRCEAIDNPSELNSKLQKLETKSNAAVYAHDSDLPNYDDDREAELTKIKLANSDVEYLNGEMNKDENMIYLLETEEERVDKDHKKYEDVDTKLKIMCELCGTRYLSQLKYEFHMERHKLNKIDRYVCIACDKETSNENLLWDHYLHTHKSPVRYACMECGKLFMKKPRLKGHQKTHEHSGIKEIYFDGEMDEASIDREARKAIAAEMQERIPVNCSLCGTLITDYDPDAINDLATCAACEDATLSLMVDGNEMKVITPRQYHCSQCPKHFVRKERLEFHEMRHNENMNEFVCSTCGKEFSAENSLYEHYLFVHKGARPHICELCGKSFQLKARLKEHHRTHTGERPYQCDVCGQRRMTMNALKLHKKTHSSHNRYSCNLCDKSFSKKQNMNEHLEKHWKSDKNVSLPQLFTCPLCIEDLPTYRMLKYHMMETHQIDRQDPLLTGQKPWHECQECHEKFKHQMSLKAHKERVHEGRVSPTFQCDTCETTFKIKQMLINHIRSKHDGEKRYKCAQCKKGFNDTKSLYNHILLHTGRKPFNCEYCNMSFRRKDSRDHHRRKHTGELPYQCPDCDQSFSTYNNRAKHRKKDHGEGETAQYSECPECGEKCNSQQEVRVHLNKHLGEKLNVLQSA